MDLRKKFLDELLKGSLILLVSMNIFNFLNYIFHFVSARLLGPINYGILATLMSIIYIFNVPNEAIQIIASRYATKFNTKKGGGRIKNLMIKSIKKFFILGLLCFLIFALLSPLIGKFLFIETGLLILTGVTLIVIFLVPITRGILQGTKKFNSLGINYSIDGFIKVTLTIVLILAGLKVYGAMSAVILGVFFAFLISFFPLKKILKEKRVKEKIKGIYAYSFPVIISIASLMILLSIDIILAKRFFSPEAVGKYAVISMLSKIIFFGTWPISKAMFPLVSERTDNKHDSRDLLKKSIFIVLIIALFILFLYFLIPKSIIRILFGSQYIELAPLLVYSAVATALLSLTNIFVLYNLCINKYNKNYLIIFFVILQIVLLFLFHDTLFQFINMLILCNALLFLFMWILDFKNKNSL